MKALTAFALGIAVLTLSLAPARGAGPQKENKMSRTLHDLSAKGIDGADVPLSKYKGKVLLVVNVASRCGFTPQYKGLQALYEKYKERGLEVLGFPCNQFGEQEPGNEKEIKSFCEMNYRITFPLFAKVDVNGANTHPIYRFLKESKPGLLGTEGIKWNFTKFLVGRDGQPIQRFAPNTAPEDLAGEIEKAL